VARDKIAANGDYNLSGERYREGIAGTHSFPLISLGETSVFRVESGGTPKSDVGENWGGGIPWATLVDLPATDFITKITTTKRTISEKGLRESSAKMIPANSVVVSTRATIGRIAINRVPIATNQGFKNVVIEDSARVLPEYVAFALTKLVPTMEAWATGGTFPEISKSKFCELEIPLPPIDVQREIVTEIEDYQKVINGARAVLDHYRPNIPIKTDWPIVELGEVCNIKTGKLNSNAAVEGGVYPFFTCSKDVFQIDEYAFDCEAILLSGNNASGDFDVKHYSGKFNAYQRTYVITVKTEFSERITYELLKYLLNSNLLDLKRKSIGGLTRYLTLPMITSIKLPLPPFETQQIIVSELQAEQSLVDSNRELITRFERKIQATLARIWGETGNPENIET
jgi:type I restriction enzyme M protein